MATYTSHYNLKKPDIGETINISDINGNMDTLDAQLYSTNQEIAKSGASYVSCGTIGAVQNHLLTKYTDMEERDAVLIAIKTTFTDTYFDVNSYWEGHMYCLDKSGTGYFTVVLTNYSSANQVVISYANRTWSYNSIHNVKNLISAEATARTNAISAEQSARASAISSAVSAEQTARENADASINQTISNLTDQQFSSFSAIPNTFYGLCSVASPTADPQSPYPNATPQWWSVIQFGLHSRLVRLASQAYGSNPGKNELWLRSKHDDAWDSWTKVITGGYVNAVVPVSTAAGSYKVGTFSSLGIPTNATIVSAQTLNELQSVCHVIGFGVSGSDIYVELLDPVQVADGNVRITYQI